LIITSAILIRITTRAIRNASLASFGIMAAGQTMVGSEAGGNNPPKGGAFFPLAGNMRL
jgi:hypothetical protein